MSTLTVRIIKSFEYRNIKNLVFHSLDLDRLTLAGLGEIVRERINDTPTLKQYQNCQFDTFKLYAQPHGAKTTSLVINMGEDEHLIYQDWTLPLSQLGIHHETELSFFLRTDYERFKVDPQTKW